MPIYANIYDRSIRKAGEKFIVHLYESDIIREKWDREELTELFYEYMNGQDKNFNEVLYHLKVYSPTLLYVKRHTVVQFEIDETSKLYENFKNNVDQGNVLFEKDIDINGEIGEVIPGRKPTSINTNIGEASTMALHPFSVSKSTRNIMGRHSGVSPDITGKFTRLLKNPLKFSKYPDKMHLLLHLEEMQHETDMKMYDIKSTTLNKTGYYLSLQVPGLAEKRPSVVRGDRLLLRKLNHGELEAEWYEGFVHEVQLNEVKIQFDDDFHRKYIKGMKVYIRFRLNRHPLKMMHRALTLTKSMKLVLFPDAGMNLAVGDWDTKVLKMKNRIIENNQYQITAIKHILSENADKVYIIYGPPGTGKTVTMVEAIHQTRQHHPDFHILVAAPSNSACDLLAKKLLEHVDSKDLWRLYAPSRKDIPENLSKVARHDMPASKENLSKFKIVVSTLITSGKIASANFQPRYFDRIFIDECGQAMEPEILVAIAGILTDDGKIILAGDPKQLGPIIRSRNAKEHGSQKSFLERLMANPLYGKRNNHYDGKRVTKLLKNYRSHASIIKISNEEFYDNELEVCADEFIRNSLCGWEHLPCKNFPVIFKDVRGKDERESSSPSFFNNKEVEAVKMYVDELLRCRRYRIKAKEIGIITPYRKQVQKIREKIKMSNSDSDSESIKVGSVEEFQGQERRVIIISTVRSNEENLSHDKKFHLGFLKDPRRFNVAVTRAKSLLIIIGNAQLLCSDKYWKKLYDFCKENNACIGTTVDDDRIVDLDHYMPEELDGIEFVTDEKFEDGGLPEWRIES